MSKTTRIVRKALPKESQTVFWMPLRSSEVSASLSPRVTPQAIRDWLISLRAVSPANHFQSQESAKAKPMSAICGQQQPTSFAQYDHPSSSWKTFQACLALDISEEFSETWPKSGMMHDGLCSELPTLELITAGKGCGFFATPNTMDWMNPKSEKALKREAEITRPGRTKPANLRDQVSNMKMWPTPTQDSANNRTKKYRQGGTPLSLAVTLWPTPRTPSGGRTIRKRADGRLSNLEEMLAGRNPELIGGKLNPTWVEWLMNWPMGWTSLKAFDIMEYLEWEVISNATKSGTDEKKLLALWWRDDPAEMEERQSGLTIQEQEILLDQMLRLLGRGKEPMHESRGKEKGTKKIYLDRLRRLRGKEVSPKTPQGRKSIEQFFREHQDIMSELSRQRSYQCRNMGTRTGSEGDLQNMRNGISTGKTKKKGASHLRKNILSDGNGEIVGRVAVGVENRVARLRAIGNGQVPLQMAYAYALLSQGIVERFLASGGEKAADNWNVGSRTRWMQI